MPLPRGRARPSARAMRGRGNDYGRVLPTHRWQGLSRRQRLWRAVSAWRPWALLALLLGLWFWIDGALVEPPAMLSGTPQRIATSFHLCGQGRGPNCVVDGDTFRLGERRIRLIGIDAPEARSPACPAEAEQARKATLELQALLNQGPFVVQGRVDGARDKYGRELMAATRVRRDGSIQNLADDLIASGAVRRYLGGLRGGWCD